MESQSSINGEMSGTISMQNGRIIVHAAITLRLHGHCSRGEIRKLLFPNFPKDLWIQRNRE